MGLGELRLQHCDAPGLGRIGDERERFPHESDVGIGRAEGGDEASVAGEQQRLRHPVAQLAGVVPRLQRVALRLRSDMPTRQP